MNAQDALTQLLVAAIPAVLLYFTGWSYLYFYLGAFGVNISEIGFDLPTVFIYAYPPLYRLVRDHWLLLIFTVIIIVGMIWVVRSAVLKFRIKYPDFFKKPFMEWMRRQKSRFAASGTARALATLVIVIFVLPFPLTWMTRSAASRDAALKWEKDAPLLVPVFHEHPLPPWSPLFDDAETSSETQRALIDACAKRGEVHLIFSTDEKYYLLCRATNPPSFGTLFEVSGKDGLLSARAVQEHPPQGDGG